jgi:hypothetical protein
LFIGKQDDAVAGLASHRPHGIMAVMKGAHEKLPSVSVVAVRPDISFYDTGK